MNLQEVIKLFALPWELTSLGNGRFRFNHPHSNGSIIFDETNQVIYPSSQITPSMDRIDVDIVYYTNKQRYKAIDNDRVLRCENRSLSDFKNAKRYFANPFKLFNAMIDLEEEGTAAVFGHYFEDVDGTFKWAWIRIEWDDKYQSLAYFEKAIADLESALNAEDEDAIARAENMLKYLTGTNWSRTSKVLKVGELADGYGWKWITDASLCSDDLLDEYGWDIVPGVVNCICGFTCSVAWTLGCTGQYLSELHMAFQNHRDEHVGCPGNLR